MTRFTRRLAIFTAVSAALWIVGTASPSAQRTYYPPAGAWAHRAPGDAGMDAAKLDAAIEYAKAHEIARPARDFSDQEIVFGTLLGSIPTTRAAANGLVIRHGYIVGEYGDTARPDPTYSVAKSMLSTVAAIAVQRGLIRDLDETVDKSITDGGYDSPHNRLITWRHHLQQESEWEGEMWGKNANFIGREAFGNGEMKPRDIREPGTYYEYNDVRINRFALSLLTIFKKPIPDVFRDEVMIPIGASTTWTWVPYHNSFVTIDGKRMASVSGGTRWGGGMWISSHDMARFGYLWLRGGAWEDRQIVPASYAKLATTPSAHGPDYGFLWWLNTKERLYPGLPPTVFAAQGAGGNTIFVDPPHDLVVVCRWQASAATYFKMVADTITK